MAEQIELKKLKLLERNPRTISKTQMEKCKASLERNPAFLWDRPILVNVVDGKYNVYGGNQRVRAARKLGWKEIPCSVSHDLTEEEIKERIILDNAHFGQNDYEMLANDYDVELLLNCGYTEQSLQIDGGVHEVENEESESVAEEKVRYCPHCNGQL